MYTGGLCMNSKYKDNDEMGFREAARQLEGKSGGVKKSGIRSSLKIKLLAMGVWWILGMMIIGGVLSYTYISELAKVLITVIGGFVFMLAAYYIILDKLMGDRKFFKEINAQYHREGMSHELAAKIDAHLMKKHFPETEKGYYNGYLFLMAIYSLTKDEFRECLRALDSMDSKNMWDFYKHESGKVSMVNYCAVRLIAVSQLHDPKMIEDTYAEVSKVFSECRGMNDLVDCQIDEACAVRELGYAEIAREAGDMDTVMTRTQKALDIMDKWKDIESLKQDSLTLKGRSSILRGDAAEASRLYGEAIKLAKNDFYRECLDKERELLGIPESL